MFFIDTLPLSQTQAPIRVGAFFIATSRLRYKQKLFSHCRMAKRATQPSAQNPDALISAEAVCGMFEEMLGQKGGARPAAAAWGVSLQLVYMVRRGERRPTSVMLAELGLEEVDMPVRYRLKKRG